MTERSHMLIDIATVVSELYPDGMAPSLTTSHAGHLMAFRALADVSPNRRNSLPPVTTRRARHALCPMRLVRVNVDHVVAHRHASLYS